MSTLRAIFAMVTLIYFDIVVVHSYTFSSTSSVLRRTSVKVKIPQNQSTQYLVLTDNFAYDDDASIYYATCDSTSNPEIQSCNLSRVAPLDADSSVKVVASCEDLQIKVEKPIVSEFSEYYHRQNQRRLVISLRPLTKGHVAFTTLNTEKEEWRWTIVNVNDCSVTNPGESLTIRWPVEYGYFINQPFVYHDSVDVLIGNDTVNSTAETTFYRVRYGYDGQKLDIKPIKFQNAASFYPVQSLSHEKGFYSIYTNDWRNIDRKSESIVTYAEPSSNVEHVIAVDPSQQLDLDRPSPSVSHELLSVCWPLLNVSEHKLRCILTNAHEVLLNVTVKMSFPKYDWLETLNLLEDRSILVVEINQNDKNFHIRRLTRGGRGADKWLEVEHGLEMGDCSIQHLTKVTEDKERDEICFNIACYRDALNSGWYARYEKVCMLRSVIREILN